MATERNNERAEWQVSSLPEDSVISPEHVALVDFACRLGSFTTNDEPGIADASNVRQHANLLMSLLAAPHIISDNFDHIANPLTSAGSLASTSSDHHYLSDASTSSATTASSFHRRDSFRFSHPSLSLDCKWKFPSERPLKTPCSAAEQVEDEESSPPAVLLRRALKVDDREAQRLSADAMARNLLQSFQKAIKWRIQAWMDSLSESLVQQEKALVRQNATKEDIQELLKTPEAQLIVRLREVVQSIEVQHAETCFHVLPQRVQRNRHAGARHNHHHHDSESEDAPLGKRRRIESEDSSDDDALRMRETQYQYSVCHALEFDGTIHLLTPAGHSEITLEVPGYIEGTFLSSEPGVEDLTAVEVEMDTDILASMVEKSCRIIVRSSIEHICKREQADSAVDADVDAVASSQEEPDTEGPIQTAEAASPYPGCDGTTPGSSTAIVTPRAKVTPLFPPPHGFLQIPDTEELESVRHAPRRISPEPPSPSMGHSMPSFTLSTPSKRHRGALPSMVSPAPKEPRCLPEDDANCFANRVEAEDKGQNLPVLVEVACAAMQAKAGLGQ